MAVYSDVSSKSKYEDREINKHSSYTAIYFTLILLIEIKTKYILYHI